MPIGDGHEQPPVGVDGRPVDRAAQRTRAGEEPEQAAVVVDDRRERAPCAVQPIERLLRR